MPKFVRIIGYTVYVMFTFTFGLGGGHALADEPTCNDGPGKAGPAVCCTRVSGSITNGREPSIAIDPLDPLHLAIGFKRPPHSAELVTTNDAWAYSDDGGVSWNEIESSLNSDATDPVLDGSRRHGGVIYYLSLESEEELSFFTRIPVPVMAGRRSLSIKQSPGPGPTVAMGSTTITT